MTTLTEAPSAASGPLLLADISGYTSFLQSVADAHRDDAFAGGAVPPAYAVMSGLLGGIVERLVPPFMLAKLEGDAVFAYSTDISAIPRGRNVFDCFAGCYGEFRRRLEAAQHLSTCSCGVCSRIDILDLKFILHAGPFVTQEIAGRHELVGPEVVMAHRLLKNGAAELVGHGAYALVTTVAAAELEIPTAASMPIVETYEHYAPVSGHVFSLREP